MSKLTETTNTTAVPYRVPCAGCITGHIRDIERKDPKLRAPQHSTRHTLHSFRELVRPLSLCLDLPTRHGQGLEMLGHLASALRCTGEAERYTVLALNTGDQDEQVLATNAQDQLVARRHSIFQEHTLQLLLHSGPRCCSCSFPACERTTRDRADPVESGHAWSVGIHGSSC